MFPASRRSLINGSILSRLVFWRKDAILIVFGRRGERQAGVAALVFFFISAETNEHQLSR